MKSSHGIWQLWGFAFTSLLGTLLHFLYDILGEAIWISPFSGVNESTWEHMKLLFWPMFIYTVFQSFFYRKRRDYWGIKLKGILLGLILIPVIFYTYNGVIGKSPDFINIAIFFVSAAVAYAYEARELKNDTKEHIPKPLALTALCIVAVLFIIFTLKTPEIGIFKDPLTDTYEIHKHRQPSTYQPLRLA